MSVAAPSVCTWNHTVLKSAILQELLTVSGSAYKLQPGTHTKAASDITSRITVATVQSSIVKQGGISSTQISKSVSLGSEVPTLIKYVAVSSTGPNSSGSVGGSSQ